MVELLKPSIEYKQSFIEAMKEFQSKEQSCSHISMRDASVNIPEIESDFPAFVEKLLNVEKGIGIPENYVPATELWLVDGNEFIGGVSIRHRLNEHLLKIGGHIGYSIRPSKRKLGYGTKILELAIPFAKKLGIEKILITCDDDNIGSQKIIQKNHGVLEAVIETDGLVNSRYWFT